MCVCACVCLLFTTRNPSTAHQRALHCIHMHAHHACKTRARTHTLSHTPQNTQNLDLLHTHTTHRISICCTPWPRYRTTTRVAAPANHQTEPTRALFLSVVWSISVLQIRLIYLLPQSPAPTSRKGAAAEGSTRAAGVTKYIEFQVGVKWQHVYLPAHSLHTTVKRRCGRLHAASRCGSRGGSYESWCKF